MKHVWSTKSYVSQSSNDQSKRDFLNGFWMNEMDWGMDNIMISNGDTEIPSAILHAQTMMGPLI